MTLQHVRANLNVKSKIIAAYFRMQWNLLFKPRKMIDYYASLLLVEKLCRK